MKNALPIVSLLVVGACTPRYAYVPTTNATATIQGKVAADYPIPPTAPQGDVRVASYGMTDVTPRDAPNEVHRALHLRVVLVDKGAAPWTFDTREQRVELNGGGAIAPAFAASNAGSPPPVVTVDHNGKRVVDLFFVLPPDLQHAAAIPEFDALWQVRAGTQLVAERTPFERLTVEPDQGGHGEWDYGSEYYWGGPYWVNPYLTQDAYSGAEVSIHRSPGFSFGGAGVGGAFSGPVAH